MTTLSSVILELLILLSRDLGIFTVQGWTYMYVSMSVAAKYAMESKYLRKPVTGSAFPWDTITAMRSRHDGLHHSHAKLNKIGLHQGTHCH